MSDLHTAEKINETAGVLKKAGMKKPLVGIVLGTGLGSLTKHLKTKITVDFEDCPHFPSATSVSHAGKVVYGTLHGKPVVAMEGRFHFFEGYNLQQVTYPVRVIKALGAKYLFLSNAAGGLNPLFGKADLMLIDDHINLIGDSPLAGPNDEKLGPRFPDMCAPYDAGLAQIARDCAREARMRLQEGVYVAVKGPQLETRAEYRFLRAIGSDAVGMSTVPEAIVAAHAGLKTLAVSCITDLCLPDALEPVNIDKIIKTAMSAEPVLTKLFSDIIKKL